METPSFTGGFFFFALCYDSSMRKKLLVIIVAVTLLVVGYSFLNKKTIDATEVLTIGNATVLYERADTEALRTQGLSGTTYLSEAEGMLFVYDAPTIPRFWMKDMNYPIDIIWISAEKKVIGFEEAVHPDTFPATFSPDTPVQYVLEVHSGFTRRANVDVGTLVEGI